MSSDQDLERDLLTGKVIGAAIEVHRHLGPGLLESVYETCLCHELERRAIHFERQRAIAVVYKELTVPAALKMDLIVEGVLIVELKAVDQVLKLHESQLLTYLRLSGLQRGIILNFNVSLMKEGIKRVSNHYGD